jgi:hypothetical protein
VIKLINDCYFFNGGSILDFMCVVEKFCFIGTSEPGLFARSEIKTGSIIGFFVGSLLPFKVAQGQSGPSV